jgi:GAF domain-containing protein/HAMP domain-containing protein
MNRLARSPFQQFSRLSYSRKFVLITLVFLIPVIAFLPLVSDQLTNIDRYGLSERAGTIYLRSLWKFSENVFTFVNTAQKYSNGMSQLSELQEAQSRTDASLDELGAIHTEYGSLLNDSSRWEQIQTQWLALKISSQNADWPEFELNQSALFESIAALTSLVGDTSYLILDPTLDTYYMMDTVLIKSPEDQRLTFESYQIARRGVEASSFTAEERTLLISTIGRLDANLKAIERNIGVSIQNDPTGEIQPIISSPLQDYQTNLDAFTDLVSATLNDAASLDPANSSNVLIALDAAYENLHTADSKLYSAASAALELGIQNRIDTSSQRLIWMAIIASLGVLSAFLIGRSMMRSISRPLVDLIGATQRLSDGDMSTRVTVSDAGEIGQVGIAFNQMAEELARDKAQLISRTSELDTARNLSEKRARDLQAIAEISRIISSEQRPDVLLPLIARLVNEKLGFEHVGFFLLDDSRRFAVLQATSHGHRTEGLTGETRLKIGDPGIVSAAILSGKPQIESIIDSRQANTGDVFLSEARSQMALPIRQGEQLIGALDIRSVRSKAFSFDNLEVFQVLASQIGIAIQNARLYEQNVQALKDTEEAYRRLTGSTWNSLVQQMDIKAFAYDGVSSRALSEVPVQHKTALLSVPVTVRGQVVGNLRLNPLDPNRIWTDDDIAMAEAVAERAALALEAARLLEDAQKRASRESFLSEMASKLSRSFQLDSILRDTVEELGQSLNGSTVSFQLVDPLSSPKAENSNGRKTGVA